MSADLDASSAFWAKITTCVGVKPVADVKRSLRMSKLQQYQKLGATVSLYSVKETLSVAFDDAVQTSGEVRCPFLSLSSLSLSLSLSLSFLSLSSLSHPFSRSSPFSTRLSYARRTLLSVALLTEKNKDPE